MTAPVPPTALRRRHAQPARYSSYKIRYVILIKNYLNPEGHRDRLSGSKVMAILLMGDYAYWWSFIGKGLRLR